MNRRPKCNTSRRAFLACTTCLLSHVAMKLPRKLYWDPIRERFKNDDEANTYLVCAQRWPYQVV